MHQPAIESYRALEAACRRQAAMSSTQARIELQRMAQEYKRLADWLERQRLEADPAE